MAELIHLPHENSSAGLSDINRQKGHDLFIGTKSNLLQQKCHRETAGVELRENLKVRQSYCNNNSFKDTPVRPLHHSVPKYRPSRANNYESANTVPSTYYEKLFVTAKPRQKRAYAIRPIDPDMNTYAR